MAEHTIPYIGTEILYETCDGHNSTQNAPKSIIPEDSKSAGHFPQSDSVKSRFKALFKKWHPWIRRCCFSLIFAPGGKLNRRTSDYVMEYISEYVSEYTSEYISEYISEYTSA